MRGEVLRGAEVFSKSGTPPRLSERLDAPELKEVKDDDEADGESLSSLVGKLWPQQRPVATAPPRPQSTPFFVVWCFFCVCFLFAPAPRTGMSSDALPCESSWYSRGHTVPNKRRKRGPLPTRGAARCPHVARAAFKNPAVCRGLRQRRRQCGAAQSRLPRVPSRWPQQRQQPAVATATLLPQ